MSSDHLSGWDLRTHVLRIAGPETLQESGNEILYGTEDYSVLVNNAKCG